MGKQMTKKLMQFIMQNLLRELHKKRNREVRIRYTDMSDPPIYSVEDNDLLMSAGRVLMIFIQLGYFKEDAKFFISSWGYQNNDVKAIWIEATEMARFRAHLSRIPQDYIKTFKEDCKLIFKYCK
jgi:hypothetical protein